MVPKKKKRKAVGVMALWRYLIVATLALLQANSAVAAPTKVPLLKWRDHIRYQALTESPSDPSAIGEEAKWKLAIDHVDVVRDGGYADVRTESQYRGGTYTDTEATASGWQRVIWNPIGQFVLIKRTAWKDTHVSWYKRPSTSMLSHISAPAQGGAMDGLLFGANGLPIEELLAGAKNLKSNQGPEADTLELCGHTDFGSIVAEFFVANGTGIKSWKVTWDEEDGYKGGKLKDAGLLRAEFEVTNTEWEHLGDARVATRAVIVFNATNSEGVTTRSEYAVRRNSIVIGQESSDLREAVLPLDQGTSIVCADGTQISYEWRAGSIRPSFDSLCFEQVSALLSGALRARAGGARGTESPEAETSCDLGSKPLCGIRCVFAMAEACGTTPNIEGLLRPKYVGSNKGSTLTELVAALREQASLDAHVSGAIGVSALPTDGPATLLVRSSIDELSYDHYVLSAGKLVGMWQIIDPSNLTLGVQLWSDDALEARWSGNAVLPNNRDHSVITASWSSIPLRSLILLTTVAALACLWLGGATHGKGPIRTSVALIAIAASLAVIFHSALLGRNSPVLGPFLRRSTIATSLAAVPHLSQEDALRLHGHSGALFIDARHPDYYAEERIDNAISVPVNIADAELDRLPGNIAVSKTLIVYCQSASCTFSDKVAQRLRSRGYLSVCVLQGGIEEWRGARWHQSGGGT